ncbi:cysteine-rich protein 2-like [Oculina patagonica]
MPKCPNCNKEVYFAEKVTSLGKDWHRPCLKCEKCKKTLSPGSHAEHDGKPYCNNPCYSAMFGPGGFGRGGAESHKYPPWIYGITLYWWSARLHREERVAERSFIFISSNMPKCPTCGKEVYFAEKVTSIGKDWHRACLKCAKCGKTLSSGGHAEHQGHPYCHNPCYASEFGPGGFGHGGTESHKY